MKKSKASNKTVTKKTPSHSAFTIVKDGGMYRVVTLTIEDSKVVEYDYSEPDIQAIALSRLTRVIADLLRRMNK